MKILVTGAGGFIGGHLVKRLLADGHEVHGIDIKPEKEWWQDPLSLDTRGVNYDLTQAKLPDFLNPIDIIYHLAADMGGLGYIGDSENDSQVMINNTQIDLAVFLAAVEFDVKRLVYASSACVYPEGRQMSTVSLPLREEDAYPAQPDLAYGWQKLYSERLLEALRSATFSPVAVRLHNVYGPHGSWTGGREKAPAAMCRKVAEAKRDGRHEIEVWGDGEATRSYMYVDDCVEGLVRIAASGRQDPINLGTERSISVDGLAYLVAEVAGWPIEIKHIDGPEGVRGRNSDNTQLRKLLDWEPTTSLEDGIRLTYSWIESEVNR